MKITVIHGQLKKGSTNNTTALFLKYLKDNNTEITEFFTNDLKPCVGCFSCIEKTETKCPHYDDIAEILTSIDNSDIVVAESPCYCMGMSGQLKILFDHFAHRWLPHRPMKSALTKCGVAFSTAAGMGANKTIKAIMEQFKWLGFAEMYGLSFNVSASSWEKVASKKKDLIEKKVKKLAFKIKKRYGRYKQGFSSRLLFFIMKTMQKNNTWNKIDREYWVKQRWIKG